MLTDHQVQTLTNNCPAGKDEAKRQLRLRQIRLFYNDPIRDGSIQVAPNVRQLTEGQAAVVHATLSLRWSARKARSPHTEIYDAHFGVYKDRLLGCI